MRRSIASAIGVGIALAVIPAGAATAVTWSALPSGYDVAQSATGRYVIFSTTRSLLSGDTNSYRDIYWRDTSTNITKLVSASSAGKATGFDESMIFDGGRRLISDDGRYVVFLSDAGGLVSGAPSGTTHAYRKDLSTGAVVLLDHTTSGAVGSARVEDVGGITADGSAAVFVSSSALVSGDKNTYADAYRWTASSVTLLSATSTGAAIGSVYNVRISSNGQAALYNWPGPLASPGWHLTRRTIATGAEVVIDTDNAELGEMSISPDGAAVAFATYRSFNSGDASSSTPDVYLWRSGASTLLWLSKRAAVAQPSSAATRYLIGNLTTSATYLPLATNANLTTTTTDIYAVKAYRVTTATAAKLAVVPSSGSPENSLFSDFDLTLSGSAFIANFLDAGLYRGTL